MSKLLKDDIGSRHPLAKVPVDIHRVMDILKSLEGSYLNYNDKMAFTFIDNAIEMLTAMKKDIEDKIEAGE